MSVLSKLGFGRRAAHDCVPTPIVLHGELEQEEDGRWIVEITDLNGVMAYGSSKDEAIEKATALALRVLADRVEQGTVATTGGFALELCLARG